MERLKSCIADLKKLATSKVKKTSSEKAVAIKHKDGEAVLPSMVTIGDGTYKPLSRPVFIYVSKKSAERPEVESIVKFYLGDGLGLAKDVGYIPLTDELAASANKRFSGRVTGALK